MDSPLYLLKLGKCATHHSWMAFIPMIFSQHAGYRNRHFNYGTGRGVWNHSPPPDPFKGSNYSSEEQCTQSPDILFFELWVFFSCLIAFERKGKNTWIYTSPFTQSLRVSSKFKGDVHSVQIKFSKYGGLYHYLSILVLARERSSNVTTMERLEASLDSSCISPEKLSMTIQRMFHMDEKTQRK